MQITTQSILFVLGFLGFTVAQTDLLDDLVAPLGVAPSTTTKGSSVLRPAFSQCYNYFLAKDKCVHSAAKASERCPDPKQGCGREVPSTMPQVFKAYSSSEKNTLATVKATKYGLQIDVLKSQSSMTEEELSSPTKQLPTNQLVRRYDTESKSFPIHSGTGICKTYTDEDEGVCIWASAADTGAASGGWINSTYTKACGRQVFIQRKGNPSQSVYANVVDGCTFPIAQTPEPGCFAIAFTKKTFEQLQPTEQEYKSMTIQDLVWDFNNIDGTKRENASV